MGFFGFMAKFGAIFAAGYGMVFAATNLLSGVFFDFAIKFAGGLLIILDVFALLVWIVNAVWYSEQGA